MTGLLVAWLAVASAVAFALCGLDKRRARRDAWRIPEATLLGWALAGGFVGAWLGVYAFRHKTRKPSFLTPLALVTIISAATVAWLLAR